MLELLQQWDIWAFEIINQKLIHPFLDTLAPILRNKKTWYPLYLILAIFLIYKYKIKGFYLIVLTIVAVGLSDIVSSHFLKNLFARTRPCNLPELAHSTRLLISKCSQAYSLPSSHAANHFAIASFLGINFLQKSKWFLITGIIWATSICWAQIYVGVHFHFDILIGVIIGALVSLIVIGFQKKLLKFNFKL